LPAIAETEAPGLVFIIDLIALFAVRLTSPQLLDLNGGRAGTRTPDLLRVKQAL
jgi:hypothetical protein